jgi:hypothetical protein
VPLELVEQFGVPVDVHAWILEIGFTRQPVTPVVEGAGRVSPAGDGWLSMG